MNKGLTVIHIFLIKLIDGKLQPERHQIHHIIPQELGGPHVWWNAHPLQAGAPHQGGVHGSGSPLNQILKSIKDDR